VRVGSLYWRVVEVLVIASEQSSLFLSLSRHCSGR